VIPVVCINRWSRCYRKTPSPDFSPNSSYLRPGIVVHSVRPLFQPIVQVVQPNFQDYPTSDRQTGRN